MFFFQKEKQETKPLVDRNAVAAGAFQGATFVNEVGFLCCVCVLVLLQTWREFRFSLTPVQSAEAVMKASADGPLTFRMLGFLGGIAMVVSNGIAILERYAHEKVIFGW